MNMYHTIQSLLLAIGNVVPFQKHDTVIKQIPHRVCLTKSLKSTIQEMIKDCHLQLKNNRALEWRTEFITERTSHNLGCANDR